MIRGKKNTAIKRQVMDFLLMKRVELHLVESKRGELIGNIRILSYGKCFFFTWDLSQNYPFLRAVAQKWFWYIYFLIKRLCGLATFLFNELYREVIASELTILIHVILIPNDFPFKKLMALHVHSSLLKIDTVLWNRKCT